MLKYKVNIGDFDVNYKPMVINSVLQDEDSGITKLYCSSAYTREHIDTLMLIRNDGEDINYSESESVLRYEIEEGCFCIKAFPNIELSVEKMKTFFYEGEKYIFLMFTTPHFLNQNRTDFIRFVQLEGEEPEETVCDGDYYVKEPYFLYQWPNDEMKNTVSTLFWTDTFGDVHEAEAIVPVTYGGKDMKYTILLKYDSNTENIVLNYGIYHFFVKDQRFFKFERENENIWNLSLQPNAEISYRKGDVKISIPIHDDFCPDLLKEDSISEYLENTAGEKVSEPIDYEKQQFVPVYRGEDIIKIVYPTHILKKDGDWNTIKNKGWCYNLYAPGGNIYGLSPFAGDFIISSDVYNAMGFEAEDVYYRKKALTETFLRLSFYNTPYRTTQRLLYTCKIYINANSLWKTYIKDSNVYNHSTCKCSFTCTERNDFENSTEGFYLHLFPANLNEIGEGEIYMKVELNNAKYGKVVLMSIPIDSSKTENDILNISYWDRIDYDAYSGICYTQNVDGNVYTDMSALTRDTYIKIKIRYNNEKHRYEWEFPFNSNIVGVGDCFKNGVMTLPLYEPRIDYVE